MSQTDLEILLKDLQALPKECEYVEFKQNNFNPQLIGEYLSALSNGAAYVGQPFGYLVYGIEDETQRLKGTNFKPKEKKVGNQELELWLSVGLNPRLTFEILEFEYQGLDFVIFKIERMRNEPVCFQTVAYIRIGSHKTKLYEHPERARKLWAQDSEIIFEREFCKYDLDRDSVLQYIDSKSFHCLINVPFPEDKAAIMNKLIEEKIIKVGDNGYNVTNLGALLFAKDIAYFDELGRRALRVILYEGKNRINAKKEQLAKRGYAVGFTNLIKYIEDILPNHEIIEKSERKTFREYPTVAIREIVANALIHQDFSIKGMTAKIEIFDDRIEVINPGRPLIDTDRFIDHDPVSRNEILAKWMYRLNFCEERGSGFDRVIELCEKHKLPAPEIKVEDMYTKIILYGFKEFKDMDAEERKRICYAHAVLKYLSNEKMTNQSLRERFGVGDSEQTSISHIITNAMQSNMIKYSDTNSKSKRYASYIPYWL